RASWARTARGRRSTTTRCGSRRTSDGYGVVGLAALGPPYDGWGSRRTRLVRGTWYGGVGLRSTHPTTDGGDDMTHYPALRRWLAAAATAAVLAAVLVALARQGPSGDGPMLRAGQDKAERSWPLYGGSVSRNLVNLVEKGIPTTWSMKPKAEENIKWSVPLGSKAYGGPIVARGQNFIRTHNNTPRHPPLNGGKRGLI